jgi:hypothetical protein
VPADVVRDVDGLVGADGETHEVDAGALLEEEASWMPAELGFTADVLLVRSDEIALHAPAADEAVEPSEGWIGLRQVRGLGHGCPPFVSGVSHVLERVTS